MQDAHDTPNLLAENIYFREAAREQVEALVILYERLRSGETLRTVHAEETVLAAAEFVHAIWQTTDDFIREGLRS